jgi:hypothetical protein
MDREVAPEGAVVVPKIVVQVYCVNCLAVHDASGLRGQNASRQAQKKAAPIRIRTAKKVRRDFIFRLDEPRIAPATLSPERTVACSPSWLSNQIHSDSARCFLPGSGQTKPSSKELPKA